MIDHTKYIDMISFYIDNELTSEECAELEAHLAECESCSSLLQIYKCTFNSENISKVKVPDSLRTNVMNNIRAVSVPTVKKVRNIKKYIASFAAVAACLAIAIGIYLPTRTADSGATSNDAAIRENYQIESSSAYNASNSSYNNDTVDDWDSLDTYSSVISGSSADSYQQDKNGADSPSDEEYENIDCIPVVDFSGYYAVVEIDYDNLPDYLVKDDIIITRYSNGLTVIYISADMADRLYKDGYPVIFSEGSSNSSNSSGENLSEKAVVILEKPKQ